MHLTKAEAPDVAAVLELAPPSAQAILVDEAPFEDKATVEALYNVMPDGDFLEKLTGRAVVVQLLPDADWIRLSQQGLPPVRAGRFFVYGKHDAGKVPPCVIPMRIEAGLAFGTGHHETTTLCLTTLSDLAKSKRFCNVLDLGCGTALLAIGAAHLWKRHVLATDIDPQAIAVAEENAVINEAGPLVGAYVAPGLTHAAIRAAAPFDLVVANILAEPLMRLAPQLARAVAKGGTLVLSGILEWQEDEVLSYYRALGLVLRRIRHENYWSALILERPKRRG